MDNKPTFKHDFKTIFGIVDIQGAQSYMKAMNAVMQHITDKAVVKDKAHYVNASELMEVCNNTFDELAGLLNAELTSDNLMENILDIVKQDAKDRLGIDLDKKDDISNVL